MSTQTEVCYVYSSYMYTNPAQYTRYSPIPSYQLLSGQVMCMPYDGDASCCFDRCAYTTYSVGTYIHIVTWGEYLKCVVSHMLAILRL